MTAAGSGPGHERAALDAVRLRLVNRWQAETLREDLADLYVESSDTATGETYRRREDFLHRLADSVRHPGFSMLLAETAALTGCAYGFPIARDGAWWLGFEGDLPRSVEQLTSSGHTFAVTEIVVHPHERTVGLAQLLQTRMLTDHHASLGATLVDQADHRVLAAFRAWGWEDIGQVHRPSDPALRRALVLPLGQRTAGGPDGLAHDARTQRPE
ncbi:MULTISPECIES: hypothetical protein [Streptomyces]|uniref:N-acetyltransferase domain-containing protein n=1 Tax=Streptomyces alboflavus TaxID=67267 RepID=A0A1Z1WFQ3_9ACTN|nr:hypothetical protein [Streptomyces alboflavus]ARX85274.1 hypothetical protein SMD44_04733 [Streptomyces alboflavus]